jgi:hypothetical protein
MDEINYEPHEIEDKKSIKILLFSWILRIPLILLLLVSWIASFYAAYAKIQNITYTVPIFYTILVVLYLIGLYIKRL